MSRSTTQVKSLGHIANTKIDLTEPLKMNIDMDHKELALFVGKNGTGKTFVLTCAFFVTYIANIRVMVEGGFMRADIRLAAQDAIGKCFDSELTGVLTWTYTSGAEVKITIDKNNILEVVTTNFEDIKVPTPVKYMSSGMRTFNAISSYLKVRRLLPGDHNQKVEQLSKEYKLYDVMCLEECIMKLPKNLNDSHRGWLKGFDYDHNVISMHVDLDKDDFYIIQKDKEKEEKVIYMKTLGAGHQSIFNMLMVQM